jgi:hypothetical protein
MGKDTLMKRLKTISRTTAKQRKREKAHAKHSE